MVYDTTYNVRINPREGETNLQIQVNEEDGAIKLSVFTNRKDGSEQKSVFTFDNDADIKTIIETLKWARVKSLRIQGFKVVM